MMAPGIIRSSFRSLRPKINRNYLIKAGLLALVYVSAAKLGLSLAETTKQVTTVWPPTGIAIVAIYLLGYRYWPGVLVGAFIANLITNEPAAVALAIAVGNTLEASVGVYFLRRLIKFKSNLGNVRSVLGLVGLAGGLSTAVSATIGTSSLLLSHLITKSEYTSTWYTWWIGDMMGALVVAPFLLIALRPKAWRSISRRLIEAAALILLLVIVLAVIFVWPPTLSNEAPVIYLIFPVIIWAALRFTQFGVVSSTLMITAVAVVATLHRQGPFTGSSSVEQNIIFLHLFIAVVATTSLLLAAVVTERQRTELALRRRTKALTKAKLQIAGDMAKLKLVQRQKNQLVSMATHELNTPLTSSKLFAGILEGQLKRSPSKDSLTYLSKLNSQLDQLATRVRDLIDVAKVRAGKFSLEPKQFDISQLINEVVFDIQIASADHKLIIENNVPQKLKADQDRIRQVLTNLLINAVKYSPADRSIKVNSVIQKNQLVVAVSDQGRGITAKDRLQIFKPFYRSTDAAGPGLGLGLYIARRIIGQHGGKLWVESRIGHGSTFYFSLPFLAKSRSGKPSGRSGR